MRRHAKKTTSPKGRNPESYSAWLARIDASVERQVQRLRKRAAQHPSPAPKRTPSVTRINQLIADIQKAKTIIANMENELARRLKEIWLEREVTDDEQ
jgi:hypothetical protein